MRCTQQTCWGSMCGILGATSSESAHPPDHSFSVQMSVCLSFLHSLTTSSQVSVTQASLSPVINTKVIFYLGIIWNVFLYNLTGCVGDAGKNKEWEEERFFSITNFYF